MSISSGKFFVFTKVGISLIVFKFKVISSPSLPSPRESPLTNFPLIYVSDAEIPSILGSALYSILFVLSKLRKLNIFFQKFLNLLH